jgi:hypothetical protein
MLLVGIGIVCSMIIFSSPLIVFLSVFQIRNHLFFYWVGLLAARLTPNLGDQASVFMSLGDRVAQLYP